MKKLISSILIALFGIFAKPKFWMTFFGVATLQALYWHSQYWLINAVPVEKVAAYESAFQTNHYAIVLAILGYLGIQGATDVFRRTTSDAVQVAQTIIKETKDVKIDGKIAVVEGEDGAPKIKPYGQIAQDNDLI